MHYYHARRGRVHIHVHDAWSEAAHLRGQPENKGEFAKAAGSAGAKVTKSKVPGSSASLVAAPADKTKWPAHIKKLVIPPAWTDVRINPDPKAPLQAIGRDAKGRNQYVYSDKFKESQSAVKFARVKKLLAGFGQVEATNQKLLASKDPSTAEHAQALALILEMGLRPGSERDTQAKEQAYGATTLRAEHVVTDGAITYLAFTGKKGVKLRLPVTNQALAKDLRQRAKGGGQLFPGVTDMSLRRYTAKVAGSGIKPKDFRTLKATQTANALILQDKAPPTTAKEYKAKVKAVATTVSRLLGNTPAVALQSYISPLVFAPWRASAGL